jgi:hypothetical protein
MKIELTDNLTNKLIATPKSPTLVNNILKSFGIEEVLVHGAGYWYFAEGDATRWFSSSVPVYRLSAGTTMWWLEQWVLLTADGADGFVIEPSCDGKTKLKVKGTQVTFANAIEAIEYIQTARGK